MRIIKTILSIASMAALSFNAHAYLSSPGTCTNDSVSINSMERSPLDGVGVIFTGLSINATSCFGMIEGNDQGGLSAPNPNIGELGDGLLNGQENIVSPTQFISADQLLALNADGIKNDPGWIYLGSVESTDDKTSYTMDGYSKPLNIDDILKLTLACTASGDDACVSGTWTLETRLDIIDKVQAVLGRNSFDHLAFVIKSSTEWAIYDFDFNILLQQLIAAGGTGFDYVTPYSFTGSWNTDDFVNKKDISQAFSHISVWARDPLPTNDMPLPGTLALVGAALLALGFSRKS